RAQPRRGGRDDPRGPPRAGRRAERSPAEVGPGNMRCGRGLLMPHATITGIHIYPVKSCRGIALDRATIGRTGFEGDRHWLVTNDSGRFRTQREVPRLALIEPAVGGNDDLRLEAPGMPALLVRSGAGGERREVTIWNDRAAAVDAGDEPSDWLSRFL